MSDYKAQSEKWLQNLFDAESLFSCTFPLGHSSSHNMFTTYEMDDIKKEILFPYSFG